MLIYFLGDGSEFSSKTSSDKNGRDADLRFFKKIGSFAKALKVKSPELVFADKSFLESGFDLRTFLSEQKIDSPVVFFDGKASKAPKSFLDKMKARCKIPQKQFELLKYLCHCAGTVSFEKMRADFIAAGKGLTANCLNVSLSRLKKALESQNEFDVSLVKEKSGYKLVFF